MKNLLTIIACFASLGLAACSMNVLPRVYKIDVQQGNVITQDMVNKLEPGMTRSQVQFIMGSPMIIDTFHQERWDYLYRFQPGYGEAQKEHITLFFESGSLGRITGTMKPDEAATGLEDNRQTTVVVPPYEKEEPGILDRLWRWVTFKKAEED